MPPHLACLSFGKVLLCSPEWPPVHCQFQHTVSVDHSTYDYACREFTGMVLSSAESNLAWSLSGLSLCAQSLHSAGVTGQLWDIPGIVDNNLKAPGEHIVFTHAIICIIRILNLVTTCLPLPPSRQEVCYRPAEVGCLSQKPP